MTAPPGDIGVRPPLSRFRRHAILTRLTPCRPMIFWLNLCGSPHFILDLFSFLPYRAQRPMTAGAPKGRQAWEERKPAFGRLRSRETAGDQNMNTAGQIAVTLAALVGFGRIFLADEGASHRLSGCLILASLVGKSALSV